MILKKEYFLRQGCFNSLRYIEEDVNLNTIFLRLDGKNEMVGPISFDETTKEQDREIIFEQNKGKVTGLKEPSLELDAANKKYVDEQNAKQDIAINEKASKEDVKNKFKQVWANMNSDYRSVTNEISEVRKDVTLLETDVTSINNDVTSINTDITKINQDVTNIQTEINKTDQNLQQLAHLRLLDEAHNVVPFAQSFTNRIRVPDVDSPLAYLTQTTQLDVVNKGYVDDTVAKAKSDLKTEIEADIGDDKFVFAKLSEKENGIYPSRQNFTNRITVPDVSSLSAVLPIGSSDVVNKSYIDNEIRNSGQKYFRKGGGDFYTSDFFPLPHDAAREEGSWLPKQGFYDRCLKFEQKQKSTSINQHDSTSMTDSSI